MSNRRPIFVTRPSVPDLAEVMPYLDSIWKSRMLSNGGPFARQLEAELRAYLGVPNVSLVANCTLGAIVAMRALGIRGEVITTPFSFVATSNAIRVAGAEPVFVDVDPVTLNIDPEAVARRITPETGAILAVHSFGNPAAPAALEEIAARHGIPLVFDAAHAFGVRVGGRSLLDYGTCSVVSFHATKVFNTFEGGAIFCRDPELKRLFERMTNHGIEDETNVPAAGINAKMSELHAAIGLAHLPRVDADIAARGRVVARYLEACSTIPGIAPVATPPGVTPNNYAFPVLVGDAYPLSRDALHEHLKEHGVFSRRYFYPLIPDLPAYAGTVGDSRVELPVARDASDRVLCLPIYPELEPGDQDWIVDLIASPGC